MKINDVINRERQSAQSELTKVLRKFPREAEVFIKEVEAGVCFIKAEEPCKHVYIVLSGKAAPQYYLGHNAFVAKHFKRLAVMGDVAALGNLKNYSVNVCALTRCRLLEVRVEDYWRWLLADEEILREQVEIAMRTLLGEITEKRILEEKTTEIRLLNYFALYCQRESFVKQKSIVVKKTREQIAEEVGGVSARTINRKIVKFEKEGIITIIHGKIHISSKQLNKIREIIGGSNEEDY